MNPRKILVTGSSGFLGKCICQQAIRKNLNLVKAAHKSDPNDSEVKILNFSDYDQVEALLVETKPDMMINCIGSYTNELNLDFENNVKIAWNLLSASTKIAKSLNIVLIGSSAEYGIVKEEHNPVSESYPTHPVSINGFTKLLQTEMSNFFFKIYGLNIKVARIFNLIGEDPPKSLFVGRMVEEIKNFKTGHKKSLSFGNLNAKRDYLSVERASEMVFTILFNGKAGEVYNVGSGQPIEIGTLLNEKLKEENIDLSRVIIEKNENFFKKHDVPIIYANIEKVNALRNSTSS